jgi:hypothetical protein
MPKWANLSLPAEGGYQPTPSQVRHPAKRRFLTAYSQCGLVGLSSKRAGVSRQMHSYWLKHDFKYREEFERFTRPHAVEALEQEAVARATLGTWRYRFGKDGKPLVDPATGQPVKEYSPSDVLLIFLLKALDPARYRERYEVQHSGELGIKEVIIDV